MSPTSYGGAWQPVVGSGAVYAIETAGWPGGMVQVAIVGSEIVEGQTGYWVESIYDDPEGGTVIGKELAVVDQDRVFVVRSIIQRQGDVPYEIDRGLKLAELFKSERKRATPTRIGKTRKRKKREMISTPAGVFDCERHRRGTFWWLFDAEFWIADGVVPWGIVKVRYAGTTLTLVRILAGVKTRVVDTPVKINLAGILQAAETNRSKHRRAIPVVPSPWTRTVEVRANWLPSHRRTEVVWDGEPIFGTPDYLRDENRTKREVTYETPAYTTYEVRWGHDGALDMAASPQAGEDPCAGIQRSTEEHQIRVLGAERYPFEGISEQRLKEKSYLQIKSQKRKVQPVRVTIVTGIRRVSLVFFFPRRDSSGALLVPASDSSVTFVGRGGKITIKTRFNPKHMACQDGTLP
ncbi:MAG: hypothetical protein L0Z50_42015 [Verrucomicrobiales bacterium]|nr:hypothetical protein [Verrucomicrobiales bacterium]